MEGNFLSRYNNKIENWNNLIDTDPHNKSRYEAEMSDYLIRCMPYMNQYTDDIDVETNINNVFKVKETVGLKRKDIFIDYLAEVENQNVSRPRQRKIEQCEQCSSSNILHFHDTSELVCDSCGLVIAHLISEEMTTIPDEVMDQLRGELKKIKIKKLDEITHAKIRGLLKKLRLNKYYEHVPYITNILNGIKAPSMPQELEERLRLMFKDIQKPFDQNCPTDRKNFLSYSYVLYKFCELLEEDEYLQYFPLLKSKTKLYAQDQIWKKICHDLQWEFIPTI